MISTISDASDLDPEFEIEQEIQELETEKVETEEYVELRKPHWLFLDASRGEEMEYGLFNYAPLAHYDIRIRELEEELDVEDTDDDLVTDGGRPRKYFWAWRDENGNYISDKMVNGDSADIAHDSPEDAERMMQNLMESNPEEQERYESAGLYKIKLDGKEMEGVEVNTEQSDLFEYSTDGGHTLPEGYDRSMTEIAGSADQVEW